MIYKKQDIIDAHKFCTGNRPALQSDKICGCFYCMKIFSPREIQEYLNDGCGTALCPYCSVDSVIGESSGYSITADFLRQMKNHWF